jgi:hypothetical protein
VCCFADADWANCPVERKSVYGWVAKVNGNPISWASKKQRTVAQSTCEAELYAEAEGIKEVLWLRGMLKELGLSVATGSRVFGDNQSTIAVPGGEPLCSATGNQVFDNTDAATYNPPWRAFQDREG